MPTEIAIIPIKPSTPLEDISTEPGTLWSSLIQTMRAQPGCQTVFWGREVENPDTVHMVIDWASDDDRFRWGKSDAFPPTTQKLQALAAGPPSLHNTTFSPTSPASLLRKAPVVECLTATLLPSCAPSKYAEDYASFVAALSAPDSETAVKKLFVGGVGGVEYFDEGEEKHGEKENGGEKGRETFFGLLGWESVDAHMAGRETEAFKGAVGGLRDGKETMGVVHVAFKEVEVEREG